MGGRRMKKVLIAGSGIVGRATGKGLASLGYEVTFVDIDTKVLEQLRKEGYKTAEPSQVDADVSMLCLPTPTVNNRIDMGAFEELLPRLGRKIALIKDYHLVVVRSTVLPLMTERMIIPLLEKASGKKAGSNFGVCVNPEFLREMNSTKDFLNPWIIVIGAFDQKSGKTLEELYEPFIEKNIPLIKTDLKTAEMIKYAHNLYNATKISFTNEIWSISQNLNIDGNLVMEVVAKSAEGMWNPRYGIRGGYPYGGRCLPKDTQAFLNFSQTKGWKMPLLRAVIEINKKMERLLGIVQTDNGKRK